MGVPEEGVENTAEPPYSLKLEPGLLLVRKHEHKDYVSKQVLCDSKKDKQAIMIYTYFLFPLHYVKKHHVSFLFHPASQKSEIIPVLKWQNP